MKKEDEHIKVDVAQLEKRCEQLEESNKKLEVQAAGFREKLIDLENERGIDKQRIADIEQMLSAKEGGRRDFELLTAKLMREILRRESCMDYKEVKNFFHFKSPAEAYRLIEKTYSMFPEELKIKVIKNSNKKKKVICSR